MSSTQEQRAERVGIDELLDRVRAGLRADRPRGGRCRSGGRGAAGRHPLRGAARGGRPDPGGAGRRAQRAGVAARSAGQPPGSGGREPRSAGRGDLQRGVRVESRGRFPAAVGTAPGHRPGRRLPGVAFRRASGRSLTRGPGSQLNLYACRGLRPEAPTIGLGPTDAGAGRAAARRTEWCPDTPERRSPVEHSPRATDIRLITEDRNVRRCRADGNRSPHP